MKGEDEFRHVGQHDRDAAARTDALPGKAARDRLDARHDLTGRHLPPGRPVDQRDAVGIGEPAEDALGDREVRDINVPEGTFVDGHGFLPRNRRLRASVRGKPSMVFRRVAGKLVARGARLRRVPRGGTVGAG